MASVLVLLVKLEHRPDDGGSQVHDGGQETVRWQELGERDGEPAGALPHTEHHHCHGEDEADAVHRHAPPECWVLVIQHGVAHQHEDNTGQERLAHFQQARSCGHVTRHLPWPRFRQAHLTHVGYGCQAGEDRGDDAMVPSVAAVRLVPKEIDRKDDRGREAEEGSVAGHGDGEIGPGHWGSGLETEQLHEQDQQGAGEAERPAEDAPVGHASAGQIGPVCYDAERHAGKQQGNYTHP